MSMARRRNSDSEARTILTYALQRVLESQLNIGAGQFRAMEAGFLPREQHQDQHQHQVQVRPTGVSVPHKLFLKTRLLSLRGAVVHSAPPVACAVAPGNPRGEILSCLPCI